MLGNVQLHCCKSKGAICYDLQYQHYKYSKRNKNYNNETMTVLLHYFIYILTHLCPVIKPILLIIENIILICVHNVIQKTMSSQNKQRYISIYA